MSTPSMHVGSTEASSPSSESAGPVSSKASLAGAGPPKENAPAGNWLNLALFSIGGVAAVGLVVVLFGAYLIKPENTGIIVAGAIILLLAVIAWIFTALTMVGLLIWQMITPRGNKRRKSPPQ